MVEQAETNGWTQDAEGIRWRDFTIPSSTGPQSIPLRLFEPASAHFRKAEPVVFMIHGGGWSSGGVYADSFAVRAFVRQLGMTVITIDYRLAPENPFPAAFEDCVDALHWMQSSHQQGGPLATTKAQCILAGFSAGGNLAAALSLWAVANGLGPYLSTLVLISPALCHYKQLEKASQVFNVELDSINNAVTPILSGKQLKDFWDMYDPSGGADVRVSPLLGESLSGLPPTYVQICGADPLRDEALAYLDRLREDGNIQVLTDMYPGMPHAFQSEVIGIPSRQRTMDDMVKAVRLLLETK